MNEETRRIQCTLLIFFFILIKYLPLFMTKSAIITTHNGCSNFQGNVFIRKTKTNSHCILQRYLTIVKGDSLLPYLYVHLTYATENEINKLSEALQCDALIPLFNQNRLIFAPRN